MEITSPQFLFASILILVVAALLLWLVYKFIKTVFHLRKPILSWLKINLVIMVILFSFSAATNPKAPTEWGEFARVSLLHFWDWFGVAMLISIPVFIIMKVYSILNRVGKVAYNEASNTLKELEK